MEPQEILVLEASNLPPEATQAVMESLWEMVRGVPEESLREVALPIRVSLGTWSGEKVRYHRIAWGLWRALNSGSLAQLRWHVRIALGQEEFDAQTDAWHFENSDPKN